MTPKHDMGEILAGGAPWCIKALCCECGEEHEAFTWFPEKRDYDGPLFRFGVCQSCILKDQEEFEAQQKLARIKEPAEVVPNLEEARKNLDKSTQEDAFDPFKERKDLF